MIDIFYKWYRHINLHVIKIYHPINDTHIIIQMIQIYHPVNDRHIILEMIPIYQPTNNTDIFAFKRYSIVGYLGWSRLSSKRRNHPWVSDDEDTAISAYKRYRYIYPTNDTDIYPSLQTIYKPTNYTDISVLLIPYKRPCDKQERND